MLSIVKNIASKYMYCKVVYSACLIKSWKKKNVRNKKEETIGHVERSKLA